MTDWKSYLESVCQDREYTEWERVFIRLDAEGPSAGTQMDLMVEAFREPETHEEETGFSPSKGLEKYDAVEALRELAGEHVLLRGRPGSGKTTTLRKLLLEEAVKAKKDSGARIPVLVSLRRFETSTSRLVQDTLQRHGLQLGSTQIASLLGQGRLFLLFDGINELPREEAGGDLVRFRLRHRASTPMVFTTRDIGLVGDLGVGEKLEMAALSPKQIASFVHACIGERDAANRMLKSLKDRMRDLAQTPLLLWMLCSVFMAKKEKMPNGLGQVFRIFAHRYEREVKKDAPVSRESRQWWPKLLAKLACHMMERGEKPTEMALLIPREEAEGVFREYLREQGMDKPAEKAFQFLDDLTKHHLLKEDAQGGIEFLHQLVQEYYAAEHLLTFLSGLAPTKIKREYLNYMKWTEPFGMMLELVDEEEQAVGFVGVALGVDPVLGARLAGSVKREFQNKSVQLVDQWHESSEFKIELLGRTRSETAIRFVRPFLDNEDAELRWMAAAALGKIGTDEAIEHLIKALGDKNSYVRGCAAWWLGEIGGDEAVEHLIRTLGDKEEAVRCTTAYALGRVGGDEAVKPLIKALGDVERQVRRNAAAALGKIGTDEAVEHLIKALGDKEEVVRWSTAYALGRVGGDEAVKNLIKALGDKEPRVRWCAAAALGRVGGDEAVYHLVKALGDKEPRVRWSAAAALGKIGGDEAVKPLIKALGDVERQVRWCAAAALGRIGGDEAVYHLVKALGDKERRVRWRAAEALGKIGNDEAVKYVMSDVETEVVPTYVLNALAQGFGFGRQQWLGLWKPALEKDFRLLDIITGVQERCRYYNPTLRSVDRRFFIVHLSDLHFGEVDRAADLYVQLLLELKKDFDLATFDALVISGDVANKSREEGYESALSFLGKITKKFDVGREKILIVPGNHDVGRQFSKDAHTIIRREELTRPISEHIHIDKGGDYIEVRDEAKYKKRFVPFQRFFKKAFKTGYPNDYSQQITWREYPNQKVLIIALNSGWELDHHYKWRSGIHPDALNKTIEKAAKDEYSDWLKIVIWHHPVKQKDAPDTEVNKTWIRDDGFMERLAVAGFSMVLHGHAHASGAWKFPVNTGKKKYELHVVGVGTVDAEEKKTKPGKFWQYNIIKITGTKVTVECRKRMDPRGISWPDKNWLDEADKPIYEFDLLDEPD